MCLLWITEFACGCISPTSYFPGKRCLVKLYSGIPCPRREVRERWVDYDCTGCIVSSSSDINTINNHDDENEADGSSSPVPLPSTTRTAPPNATTAATRNPDKCTLWTTQWLCSCTSATSYIHSIACTAKFGIDGSKGIGATCPSRSVHASWVEHACPGCSAPPGDASGYVTAKCGQVEIPFPTQPPSPLFSVSNDDDEDDRAEEGEGEGEELHRISLRHIREKAIANHARLMLAEQRKWAEGKVDVETDAFNINGRIQEIVRVPRFPKALVSHHEEVVKIPRYRILKRGDRDGRYENENGNDSACLVKKKEKKQKEEYQEKEQ